MAKTTTKTNTTGKDINIVYGLIKADEKSHFTSPITWLWLTEVISFYLEKEIEAAQIKDDLAQVVNSEQFEFTSSESKKQFWEDVESLIRKEN